jgi:hypothetical protein
MRRWGCAVRSYPSHSTSSSPAMEWERGAWREQVPHIQPGAGIGRVSVWVLCAQDALATSGILRLVNARPGARRRLLSIERPLPACSRRLASLQAACSLCQAYGMHASRRQQQPCVWNAAADGTCVRQPSQSLRSDRGCSPRMASVCSLHLQQCSGCNLHLR